MKTRLFFCVPLVGLLLTAALVLASPAAFAHSLVPQIGGFSQTCSNISMNGSILAADCKTKAQGTNHTTLDLNLYIRYEQAIGQLEPFPPEGKEDSISEVCSDLHIGHDENTVFLGAQCEEPNNLQKPENSSGLQSPEGSSELNLDEYVRNQDGTLIWQK